MIPYDGSPAGLNGDSRARIENPKLPINKNLKESTQLLYAVVRAWCGKVAKQKRRDSMMESCGVSIKAIDLIIGLLIQLLLRHLVWTNAPRSRELAERMIELCDGVKVHDHRHLQWVTDAFAECEAAANESFPHHGNN